MAEPMSLLMGKKLNQTAIDATIDESFSHKTLAENIFN